MDPADTAGYIVDIDHINHVCSSNITIHQQSIYEETRRDGAPPRHPPKFTTSNTLIALSVAADAYSAPSADALVLVTAPIRNSISYAPDQFTCRCLPRCAR